VCDVHMCTCARAHTHTYKHTRTDTRANASLSLSLPNPHPFLLLLPGHKRECTPAARADTRTAAKPTADQMRVLKMLEQLDGAADWRGVAAQERAARAVAAAVRNSMPSKASFVYSTLGNAYRSLGDYAKAIEYLTQSLAIAKEVGDRAGEGRAYGNLGITCFLQGDYGKAIEYHVQHLAIAKEVGDREVESGAYGNLGNAYDWQGDFSKAIECHTQHLAITKQVGNRAGEGRRTGILALATCT
jgi:tetratricopeptide (TPR) repeat protein